MPEKELVDYVSVTLKPGESQIVVFTPDAKWRRYWSEKDNGWRMAEGPGKVLIGTSSRDIPVSFGL